MKIFYFINIDSNVRGIIVLGLKFGVHMPIHGAYSYDAVLKVALSAEELGFDSLWVGDHFFLPAGTYERIGGDPERPDKLDAWTTLTAIATKTEKIRLGTRVSPIPFYLPGRLSKIVTTLDIISDGRAVLGAGAGWHKDEAVSYGVEWNRLNKRIEKMIEGLEVIKRLWTSNRATFKGKYYWVEDAPHFPKPIQKPHPPIWFGGHSEKILESVADFGDGWLPLEDTPIESFQEGGLKIRMKAMEKGRDPNNITFAPAFPVRLEESFKEWIEKINRFIKVGAQHILIDFSETLIPPKKALNFLKLFNDEIIPNLMS